MDVGGFNGNEGKAPVAGKWCDREMFGMREDAVLLLYV
jgi:hypothetical protein